MNNAYVVVPDLFLPQDIAAEACAGLALPALGAVLARAQPEPLAQETLEQWLCDAFGVKHEGIAPVTLRADGREAGEYYWLRADPVHLSLQRDQLVLLPDVRPTEQEAEQLCASLNAHFGGDGLRFFAPHPQRWYLQLREAPEMSTSALAQVEGCNVYEHLPQGEDALRWHAIFNEIQMLFYEHAVNQAREARGELPINSVWLWGGGIAGQQLLRPGSAMFTDSALAAAFAREAGIPCGALPDDASRPAAEGEQLIVWEGLRRAYQRGDLYAWREELQRLEQECLRPLLGALYAGRTGRLTLDVPQAGASRRFVLTRGAAWKLWLRPKLPANYVASSSN